MAKSATKQTDERLTALNVRDFPEDLLWKCREKAAQKHLHLREFVIEVLRKATGEQER